jgi:hypothetical protein
MSYIMSMFIQDDQPILSGELAEFIDAGDFFEGTPVFKYSPPNSDQSNAWTSLDVTYSPRKRPIVFWNFSDPRKVAELVQAATDDLKGKAHPSAAKILQGLQATRRVIAGEFTHEAMTENSWDMLDRLEQYVLSTHGGFLYAPNDGFYAVRDEMLEQVLKL